MKPNFVSTLLWPLSLMALGGFLILGAVHGCNEYMQTGSVTYGSLNKRISGLPALAMYVGWGLGGAYLVATGLRQLIHGPDKESPYPDEED